MSRAPVGSICIARSASAGLRRKDRIGGSGVPTIRLDTIAVGEDLHLVLPAGQPITSAITVASTAGVAPWSESVKPLMAWGQRDAQFDGRIMDVAAYRWRGPTAQPIRAAPNRLTVLKPIPTLQIIDYREAREPPLDRPREPPLDRPLQDAMTWRLPHMASGENILGQFLGSDDFPVAWESEQEQGLFWVYDDLHCPHPLSPMYFDIGGWWLSCDHMFRRFGTPFAVDWLAKNVNGYLYTAAIPGDSDLVVSAREYGRRYWARVPVNRDYAAKLNAYSGKVLPVYGQHFADWWRDRLVPEMERNFAYLEAAIDRASDLSLAELAVLLEDAIDIHDRHWKIHWMLNFAQFSASMRLREAMAKVRGGVDEQLLGRLQNSAADRNWDSVEGLWAMKEQVRQSPDLSAAFAAGTGNEILTALSSTESGQAFVSQQLDSYRRTFGWRAVWSHEFIFPTFLEQPAPILEQVRGYLQTAYDYPAAVKTVRDDLAAASEELLAGLTGDDKEELASANAVNLRMAPLTPDHHFYIDQGSNARLRVVLMTIGSRLTAEGILNEPDDVMFLKYDELRHVIGDPVSARATQIVTARRAERDAAAARRPRDWIGTVTESALAFPYWVNWGYPERFYRAAAAQAEGETASLSGIAGSPGLVEGVARVVLTTEEFDQVADGEILVCQMTNPAWVALFTKISGLVTDSGGTTSHPAVLAREFGIPAVVGTSVATYRIGTGDRIRVDGSSGTVSIQPRSSRQSETAELTFG